MEAFKLLVPAERVESVLDPIQAKFGGAAGFRVVVLSVEASLPRKQAPKAGTAEITAAEPQKCRSGSVGRSCTRT